MSWAKEGMKPIFNTIIFAMFDSGIDDSEEVDEEESEGEDPGIGDLVDGFDDLRVSQLSATSDLKDLRAFIAKHKLDVSPGIGGGGRRRTKENIYDDIVAALEF
jgi:hypothetical protein